MKMKNFLIKIFGFMTIILLIVLYFIIYFFPAVKSINLLKRNLKLKETEINDYLQVDKQFVFLDQRERSFIRDKQWELKNKFPEINKKIDLQRLSSRISKYIKDLAKKDNIKNLVIVPDSSDLKINITPLFTSREIQNALIQFSHTKIKEIKLTVKQSRKFCPGKNQTDFTPSPFGNLNFQPVIIAISAELKNALNFINHLTWSDSYIQQDKLYVSRLNSVACYLIFIKVYFIEKQSMSGINEHTFTIDQNSEFLLNNVYNNPVNFARRELNDLRGKTR